MTHETYMRMAVAEAKKGIGRVNPNPLVGAVLVKDGRILSKDYHHQCGQLHAERLAILHCTEDLTGATLYVTLEPCCHQGRTPPCTEIILESGISTVVVGSPDPNPLVAGKGIGILRDAGLTVVTGVLEEECREMNRVFFHFIETKTPYVVMKYAMTADGKIATRTGESRWVTGEAARRRVQKDRNRYTGIMVGVGTVLADDPLLTCRISGGRNPVRIVCDTRLRTPADSRIVKTAGEVRTILATCVADPARQEPFRTAGCELIVLPEGPDGHLELPALMAELGRREIDGILLEGGGSLNWSALRAGIVRRVQAYVAPKLFGGAEAKSPVEGPGVSVPGDAFLLEAPDVTKIGKDLLLEWEVRACSPES